MTFRKAHPATILAAMAVLGLSACSSPAAPPAPNHYDPTGSSLAETPAAPNAPGGEAPSPGVDFPATSELGQGLTYHFIKAGAQPGYQVDVNLTYGAPIRSEVAPAWVQTAADCQPDPAKDLVVPFVLVLTNVTPDFASKVLYEVHNPDHYGPVSTGSLVSTALLFPDSTVSCSARPVHVAPANELAPGESVQRTGFVRYLDFYGPSGDKTADLRHMFVTIGGGGNVETLISAGGPAARFDVATPGSANAQYLVPLDGVSNPCGVTVRGVAATC